MMWIESVIAEAFGPFTGQKLDLAPGMNVLYGPNEAGKSSWHAAIYLGLCGLRRGRGRQGEILKTMISRHAPWADPSRWEVRSLVVLDSGRRIELRQDLANRTGSATDANQGRDYTNQIIHDGAPDGARWVGLDRDSFLATACVRQASIHEVIERADALQEDLQRAAATAGTQSTAARALKRLKDFTSDRVGRNWANSSKPLRMAHVRIHGARESLVRAKEENARLVAMEREAHELARKAADASRRVQLVEAATARKKAQEATTQLDRVEKLAAKHPTQPTDPSEGSDLGQQIQSAVQTWDEMPESLELEGRTSAEIEQELHSVPPAPMGETEPRQEIRDAHSSFTEALTRHRLHADAKPQAPTLGLGGGLTSSELRDLARRVGSEPRPPDPAIEQRYQEARANVDRLKPGPRDEEADHRSVWARLGSAFLAAIAFLFRWKRRPSQVQREAVMEELHTADTALQVEKARIEQAQRDYEVAVNRTRSAGLPVNQDALTDVAKVVAEQEALSAQQEHWASTRFQIEREVEEKRLALSSLLDQVGVEELQDFGLRFARYEAECAARKDQANRAHRRPELAEALNTRKALEAKAVQVADQRHQAESRLRSAHEELGFAETEPSDQAAALQDWLDELKKQLPEKRLAWGEWQELQTLLGGTSVEQLSEAASQAERTANRFSVGLDEEQIEAVDLEGLGDDQLDDLRGYRQDAQNDLAHRRGAITTLQSTLPSVAEAEEEVAAAETELARVNHLAHVLETTTEFLEAAQDRIHHDLAPILQEAVRSALPAVTAGRYTDVRVNAKTLRLSVLAPDGEWRDASLLSHGTTEQIYLLLRVALAKHLTKPKETCPLILDDVTVQCDATRKRAVLELLHATSAERQVILFIQEQEVTQWVRSLLGDRDKLIQLPEQAGLNQRNRRRPRRP